MPPYKPYASKAQARKLHAMANRGEIAKSEVAGKDKATNFKKIPERVNPTPGNTSYPVTGARKAMANKSGIHINPEHKGKFTAAAKRMGMGVQAAASKVLGAKEGKYSPELRKEANFARNAKHFHHGGHGEKPGNTSYEVQRPKQASDNGTADPLSDAMKGQDPGYLGSKAKGDGVNNTPGTQLGPAIPGSKVGQVEYTAVKGYRGRAPF